MTIKYFFIISCLFITSARGQSVEKDLVDVQIVNDSLQTFARNPELTLTLRFKNNSDENLLLYGFDSNVLTTYVDQLCTNQDRISAGIGLLIFNGKHEQVYAVHSIHDSDSIAYKPMPKERFERLMEQGRIRYLSGTKVLKRFNITCIDKKFDLHEFPLRKGIYYLQLIYFAGKSLMTVRVGAEQIEKDKKAHNAELYQGCAISNEITFRVN